MRCSETLRAKLRFTPASAWLARLAFGGIALALASGGYAADDQPASGASVILSEVSVSEAVPLSKAIASVLSTQFGVSWDESTLIARAVLDAANHCAMSPVLLLAVISTESGFDRHAISGAGARGLMQVLPTAHPRLVATATDLSDPADNVRIGSLILRDYLDATGGDLSSALRRYSGGGKGYAKRVAQRMREFARSLNTPVDDLVKLALVEPR